MSIVRFGLLCCMMLVWAALPARSVTAQQVGFDAAERAYLEELVGILEPFSTSMIRAGELMQHPRPLDETWVTDLALQFAIWQLSYEAALTLDPPPAFQEIHALYLEALRLSSTAADEFAQGLDRGDAALIDQAAQHISQANDNVNLANALLNDLLAARGG